MRNNLIKPTDFRLIVCIYTCDADDHLLKAFYSSVVMKELKGRKNTELIEVRASDAIEQDEFLSPRLTVKTTEHYANLPRKSFCMISYLSARFEFDYILKIDVTTLTTAISNKLLTGGKQVSEPELLEYINDVAFYRDYNGYVQLNAKRKGAENWANKKGIDIDYQKVFDTDDMPSFYSGKMWLIDRNFAVFIADCGGATVDDFSKYFPAEDVMIGFLYQKFLNYQHSKPSSRALLSKLLALVKRR